MKLIGCVILFLAAKFFIQNLSGMMPCDFWFAGRWCSSLVRNSPIFFPNPEGYVREMLQHHAVPLYERSGGQPPSNALHTP